MTGDVFALWHNGGVGSGISRISMIRENGVVLELQGVPDGLLWFTAVRRSAEVSSRLWVDADERLSWVTFDEAGSATSFELLDLDVDAFRANELNLRGSGDLLAVTDLSPSMLTTTTALASRGDGNVRIFELGDLSSVLSSPFNATSIAPDIPAQSYLVGEFDQIKNRPVFPPGADPLGPALPAEDCLVDVSDDEPYTAICFSPFGSVEGLEPQTLRETYIEALVATERPPDEALWIGQADETPVKP